MIRTSGTTIECFRGNSGHIYISKTDSDGNIEPFEKNDEIIFTVKNNFAEEEVVLRKKIKIEETTNKARIDFSKEDTLIGDLISDAVDYEYDISVNGNNTILGHDSSGAKIFKLYPSGCDDA